MATQVGAHASIHVHREELNAASGFGIKPRDSGAEGSVYKNHPESNNQSKVVQVKFSRETNLSK